MSRIIFISGPCGCGKSTFADVYAKHLVRRENKTVYVIHGDDFHAGFVEPEDKPDFFMNGLPGNAVLWKDILRFNWDCIIDTADKVLQRGMDVVIDYVVETEMPRVQALAERYQAGLYYIVLTADADEIERRIRARGDVDMIERARFLKGKLDALPMNRGHLFDNTGRSPEEMAAEISLEDFAFRGGNA